MEMNLFFTDFQVHMNQSAQVWGQVKLRGNTLVHP